MLDDMLPALSLLRTLLQTAEVTATGAVAVVQECSRLVPPGSALRRGDESHALQLQADGSAGPLVRHRGQCARARGLSQLACESLHFLGSEHRKCVLAPDHLS